MANQLFGVQAVESNANRAVAVTTHNTNTFKKTKGVYVGISGDLALTMSDGNDIIFKNLASGMIHPISAIRVKTTGTTAQNIVVVY